MAAGATSIDRELANYKQVASDLHVGVNHLALDEERIRQEQFLQGIIDLQRRIGGNEKLQERYGEEIEDLKNGIRLNADVLSYLKGITKLEAPLTELTNKIAQAAVAASSSNAASQTVYANKALTENVNNCWEYIAKLSAITQTHLKDAASYQQFHHMANEVDAHIDKMIGLAEMKMLLFAPQGLVDEAVLLAQELENDHVELVRTWEQTCQLTEMARHLKPVQNRLSRVVCGRTVDTPSTMAQQVVMVKALIDLSGPDFAIRKGEEMILMNNENPNFWRVKTTFGEREVPSLIFTTVGPNQDEVFKANSLQRKCVSDWKRVLERTKGKLVKYYTTLFEGYCKNDAVYFIHEDEMNAFLDDLDSVLIAPNYDSGTLNSAYVKFTNTLMLLSPHRRPPRGAVSLNASDIRALHAPLRRILDQTAYADQVQARVSMNAEEVQRYLKSIEDERLHIFNEISRIEKVHQEKENQLKSLQERMNSWKNRRNAFDRVISEYTSEPVNDILKHFPATRFPKPQVVENNYRTTGDNFETDPYESSGETHSSSDYGQVAKQMVTSHTRQDSSGTIFAGAASLKRSVSTNDLQTQILRVTVNAGSQYNRDDFSESRVAEMRRSSSQLNGKSTSDVQAQIIRVNKNAASQVGVRVMPKAIDLSRVGIENLGLEVQNSKESEGLGLRVGELLCPVSVGTSVELFEGPGVQVLGINDVDSLNLGLRNAIAYATTDSQRRFKVREVQTQVINRPISQMIGFARNDVLGCGSSADALSSEVQTQIGILNKPAAVQAVARMEVVNIPSHRPKVKTTEGTSTAFHLLPDMESKGFISGERSTSDVMTQISCILHSRGIHSDLESYLSEYKKRNSITATSNLCTQIQHIAGTDLGKKKTRIGGNVEAKHGSAACDTETLIHKVVRDCGTQVSSKLVPTEVTISKISTMNMEISLTNPLKEIDIGLPVDSLICPADMKFQTELYEGSDISIADYKGIGNLVITHNKEVAFGSLTHDGIRSGSVDFQTNNARLLSTQAALVLRTKDSRSKAKTAELAAHASVVPKLSFVVSQVFERADKAPTSDLQTQISNMVRLSEIGRQSADLVENEPDFNRCNANVPGVYSTTRSSVEISHASVNNAPEENLRAIVEILCPKCYEKYREIQTQFDPKMHYGSKQDDIQTQVSYVVSARGVQSTSTEIAFSECAANARQIGSGITEGSTKVPVDASMQVGSQLIPLSIGVSPVSLENMEASVSRINKEISEQTSPISAILYPAQVELQNNLVDGQSGIEILPLEKIGILHIDSSRSSTIVRCSPFSVSDVQTQIITEMPAKQKPNLLPASIVLETGQFDGRRRGPTIASRSVVCELLNNRLINQTINIRAKIPDPGDPLGPPSPHVGYVTKEAVIQTVDLSVPSVEEDFYFPAVARQQGVGRQTTGVQVGAKLVPQVLKLSQIPINNLKLEAPTTSTGWRESLSLQSIRCPAEIEMKTELCDDSGIVICSLDQSGEMEIEMASDGDGPRTITREQSTRIKNKFNGWWSSLVNGKTPLFENKPLANAAMKKSSDGFMATSSGLRLQAEAILQTDKGDFSTQAQSLLDHDLNPRYRLVMIDSNVQNSSNSLSGSMIGSTISEKRFSLTSTERQHLIERSVQVGIKLIPSSIEVKPLKVENMEAVLIGKTSRNLKEVDVSAIFCTSGIHYHEELSEATGVSVVQIDESGSLSLDYCGDRFATSITSAKKGSSIAGGKDGSKNFRVGSGRSKIPSINVFSSRQDSPVFDPGDLEFTTTLRVKDVQYSTGRNQTRGYWESRYKPSGEVSFVRRQKIPMDKDIQVGLKLVPKDITVDEIRVENLDVVNEQEGMERVEHVGVRALLCTKPTRYDEVLTESRGVNIIPIENVHDIYVESNGETFYTTVDAKPLQQEGAHESTKQKEVGKFSKMKKNTPHLRVHYAESTEKANKNIKMPRERSLASINSRKSHLQYEGLDQSRNHVDQTSTPQIFYSSTGIQSVDNTTQVGAVLVPTELKLQQMSLDASRVPHIAKSIAAETVLCPTDMAALPILSECSGVQIASVRGTSEISLKLSQGDYNAEVLRDTQSNQTRLAIKEMSVTASKSLASGFVSLIEPSSMISAIQQIQPSSRVTSSTSRSLSSKSVQVGTLLIPTNVTMEKVKVNNLEVSVPLNQSRTAEVSVSAVLASSATEMTPVLTNAQGIHVLPLSRVDEVSVHANGKSFLGTVDGSGSDSTMGVYHSSSRRATECMSVNQDQEKFVLPLASSSAVGISTTQMNLLRQSTDLSLVHEALCSGRVTPKLREVDSTSTSSFRRPGLIQGTGHSLTHTTEASTVASHVPTKEVRDYSAQVGLKLVPQTVSVQRDSSKNRESVSTTQKNPLEEEVDIHNMLCSSEFQYRQILQESSGVDVVPVRDAKHVSIKIASERPFASIDSRKSHLQYEGLDQSRNHVDQTSTPQIFYSSTGIQSVDNTTQVGAVLVPTELKLQQMSLDASRVPHIAKSIAAETVLCPTDMAALPILSECSGVQIASVRGTSEISLKLSQGDYNAEVLRDTQSNQTRLAIKEMSATASKSLASGFVSLIEPSSMISAIQQIQPSSRVTSSTSRSLSSKSVQVGTLLIPTNVTMEKVKVNNLEVSVPLNQSRTAEVSVSAVLASSATEMTPVLTNAQGIHVLPLSRVDEVSVHANGKSFLGTVDGSGSDSTMGVYHSSSRRATECMSVNQDQEKFVLPLASSSAVGISTTQMNLLRQSTDLSLVHEALCSGRVTPKLREVDSTSTSSFRRPGLIQGTGHSLTHTTEASTVASHVPTKEVRDYSAQVGLKLVPQTVSVQRDSSKNRESVSTTQKNPLEEEVDIHNMLCSSEFQYRQILQESSGVDVVPVRDAKHVSIKIASERPFASIDSRKSRLQYEGLDQSRNHVDQTSTPQIFYSSTGIQSVDNTTQVGAVLVPTELKLQQMSLDASRVPHIAKSIAAETVLCPTDMAALPILSECSGVQIASVRGTSEISLKLSQGDYNAEVLRDTQSNQTRLAIKEMSATASKSLASGFVSLIEPSSMISAIQQIQPSSRVTSSTSRSLSSKSVQVGTLLIPTNVTMEKVKVNNLEVSVPLNQSRTAEVSVSAVLASSATEMTPVLTNAQGIHVLPLSRVDEVSVHANGKSFLGTVDGSGSDSTMGVYHSSSRRATECMSVNQDQEKFVLPLASSSAVGISTTQMNLLRQSTDLSLVHEALCSGRVTPKLREVDSTSTSSFRRPGLIQGTGHSLTHTTEASTVASHVPTKEVRDYSAQVGLKLVPQTVSVQRDSSKNRESVSTTQKNPLEEEVDIHNMLCSSEFQYRQILQESSGVDVVPVRDAKHVSIKIASERPFASIDSRKSHLQYEGLDQSRNHVDQTSTPQIFYSSTGIQSVDNTTQVGAVLVPTELKLQQMSLDASRVPHIAKSIAAETVLCPTDMAALPILSECSGVQIASVRGTSEISLKLSQGDYNAEVLRDTQSNQTRLAIKEMSATASKSLASGFVSLIEPSSMISAIQQIQPSSRVTSSTSRSLSSKSVQVGTLLIPTNVTMEKVKVNNLEVSVPLNQSRTAEVSVSAVLASSATEMTPVLTNAQGIHVLPLSRVDEVSVHANGKSFLGTVDGSGSDSTMGVYHSSSRRATECMSVNQDQEKFVLPLASSSAVGISTTQMNLLRQSTDLSLVHEALCSGRVTPKLREVDSTSTSSFRRPGLIQGTGHSLTHTTEASTVASHVPTKEVRDYSAQVGLKLVPQTVSVQRDSSKNRESVSTTQKNPLEEEVDIHNMLCSSEFQYRQILQESSGVDVVPVRDAKHVSIKIASERPFASIDSRKSRLQYEGLDQSRNHVDQTSTPQIFYSSTGIQSVDNTTQVGAVLVPTELKLQQMSLDASRVPHIAKSIAAETVLCPTDMAALPILSECSGVQIASVRGTSEISLKLSQGDYNAEVLRDTQSNQTRLAIKEMSATASKSLASGFVSLIEPSSMISAIQQIQPSSRVTSSTSRSLSSKSVQVGTLLIPTNVTMEKVKVNNLEVSVPLNQSRTAEVSVSAVLASSATEMTPVLTNAQGIHVLPLSRVDEVSVHANGKSFLGTVDGSGSDSTMGVYHSSSRRATECMSVNQDQEKFVLPLASSSAVGISTTQMNLLRQSTDLSLVHEALCSGRVTPKLREVDSTSTSSFRRPGLIQGTGHSLTHTTEASTVASHVPTKEVRDYSAQVGLKLVPQTVSVQRDSSKNRESVSTTQKNPLEEEVDIHNMLCSSEFQYRQILQESSGVDVVPVRDAKHVSIKIASERPFASIDSRKSRLQYEGLDQSRNHVDQTSTPQIFYSSTGIQSVDNTTQVGAVLVPTELKLQQMSLDASRVPHIAKSIAAETVLCPTDMAALPILSECSGVQIASVRGTSEISLKLSQGDYNAEVLRDTQSNQTRLAIKEMSATASKSLASGFVSLIEPSSMISAIQQIQPSSRVTSSTSRSLSSKSVQVGTLLIPTNVTMEKVKVNNLEVSVPLNQSRTAEVSVSAVLASSATEMTPVLTNAQGIHVLPLSRVDEVSVHANGKSFLGTVDGSGSDSTMGVYHSSSRRATECMSVNQDQEKFVLPLASSSAVGISTTQMNLLRQSTDLSLVHEALCSGRVTPKLREVDSTSTSSFRRPGLIQGTGHSLTHTTEASTVASHVPTKEVRDYSAQVGLKLVPQTVSVQRDSSKNRESVSTTQKNPLEEEVDIHNMLCSSEFQYRQILQESSGVDVVPVRDAKHVSIKIASERPFASIDSRKSHLQYEGLDQSRNHVDQTSTPQIFYSSTGIQSVDNTTQVGAVLVPTELKLQQMSLDASRVPHIAKSIAAETVLCPTDMAALPILSECSGVQIASVRGTSEISLKLSQGDYNAEVLRDTQSNQTRLAIKEMSATASKSLASGFVSLIEPSSMISAIQQIQPSSRVTSSTSRSLSSKSVQVGTLLIPTNVTMEKVKVNNLEVSVPLNQSRTAEVSVSAVLASSATEMTPVLTNAQGIHVLPLSRVDEVSVHANGKSFLGTVDGSGSDSTMGVYHSSSRRATECMSVNQDQEKFVLPLASSSAVGISTTQMNLLRQSTDLSLVHEALCSGRVTPKLREVDSTSTSSFRRPGLIQGTGHSLTHTTEASTVASHVPTKEVRDYSAQVGLKLVPQTVSVQRDSSKNRESVSTTQKNPLEEEVDIHNMLCSSEFQYRQILQESSGVDVVPVRDAKHVSIKIASERPFASIDSRKSHLQYEGLDQSRNHVDQTSTPQISYSSAASKSHPVSSCCVQVGAILIPQQLSLERVNLQSTDADLPSDLKDFQTKSLFFPSDLGVDIVLCDGPGLQMANFSGNISVALDGSNYNANVFRASTTSDSAIHLVNKFSSCDLKSSMLGLSLTSISKKRQLQTDSTKEFSVSTASQVGTLLVPTKVCMEKIDVEHLVLEKPMTNGKSMDLNVSAILASTATEMVPILTDDAGFQVVEMDDLNELGIHYGNEVYVASVAGLKRKSIIGNYGPTRDSGFPRTNANEKQEVIFIPMRRSYENVQMSPKAATLLRQSIGLQEIRSCLQSSATQPRLRIGSTTGTPIRFTERTSSLQEMNSSNPDLSSKNFVGGHLDTKFDFECQFASPESRPSIDAIESELTKRSELGNNHYSSIRPLRQMALSCDCGRQYSVTDLARNSITISCNTCHSHDTIAANSPGVTSLYTCECGKRFISTALNNSPFTNSGYLTTGRPFCSSELKCGCGRQLELAETISRPVEISCSACRAKGAAVVEKLRRKSILACDCGRQYISGDISENPLTMSCSACGSSGTIVINSISCSQGYQSYNVTCEALIEPTMASKRLTANIRPDFVDSCCQFNATAEGISLESNEAITNTPHLLKKERRPQKRTHSEESHAKFKTENVCINCRNRMTITDISVADADDPNSYEALIRIRRQPDIDYFDNSVSTNLSRASTLRQSFLTRCSDRRSTGSFESLRSQSPAIKCAVCHNEMNSGDLTTSIRTSTSSIVGTSVAVDMRAKEIVDAYTRAFGEIEQSDGSIQPRQQVNLYHSLQNNRIIQSVISDYEKNKESDGGCFFVEAKEIANVLVHTEKKTTYSRLKCYSLVRRVVESYEEYKQSTKVDGCTQTASEPLQGQVVASRDVQEIIDVVNAFEHERGLLEAERTMYTELKGNPIVQRVIKEFEVARSVLTSTTIPSSKPFQVEIISTRDSKGGILNLDGQVAKMESEQFITPEVSTRGHVHIIRRQRKSKSQEKSVSSSVSSGSEDEDHKGWGSTPSKPDIIRFDVAVSALITPETWDKKMQFDSLSQ